ncbi:MAG: hypothetical protein ACXVBC_13765, partial [Bdellovibrionota bacterium]
MLRLLGMLTILLPFGLEAGVAHAAEECPRGEVTRRLEQTATRLRKITDSGIGPWHDLIKPRSDEERLAAEAAKTTPIEPASIARTQHTGKIYIGDAAVRSNTAVTAKTEPFHMFGGPAEENAPREIIEEKPNMRVELDSGTTTPLGSENVDHLPKTDEEIKAKFRQDETKKMVNGNDGSGR